MKELELERSYTTWKNPSDQVFRRTKDLYRVDLISNKKEFIKIMNTLLYSFVWKGKDKVTHSIY